MEKRKRENWVFVETKDGKDYYVNTIPDKRMIFYKGVKNENGEIEVVSGDYLDYLDEKYRKIILEYRKKYIEEKKKN
ncbi:MAG: hypothetical protein ACP5IV_07745 [Caldisericia bacterium]